jgi:hypothetical protein
MSVRSPSWVASHLRSGCASLPPPPLVGHHSPLYDSQVSGQKFYYLRNAGALLELALVSWAMGRVAGRHGFTPVTTPDLVKGTMLEKCGFQPRGAGTQVGGWVLRPCSTEV